MIFEFYEHKYVEFGAFHQTGKPPISNKDEVAIDRLEISSDIKFHYNNSRFKIKTHSIQSCFFFILSMNSIVNDRS